MYQENTTQPKVNTENYVPVGHRECTFNNITKTGYEWSEYLGVQFPTFARRLLQYGKEDERTFFSLDEMNKYRRNKRQEAGRIGAKNKRLNNKKEIDYELEPLDINKLAKNPACMFSLIESMILDAKENVTPSCNGNRSKYYEESKRWLMNNNNGLKNLIKNIKGIHTQSALKGLKEYAEQH